MSQQYSLKWNNHLPNFIAVFGNLLRTQTLVDVTLSAEGRHLRAHKIVLSACSTYFHTLFVESPNQHPIVILKDVTFADLLKMVDFMYFGEVNVTQEQLPKVLDTAKTLKIKGLTETDTSQATSLTRSQGGKSESQSPGGSNDSPISSPPPKRLRRCSSNCSTNPALPEEMKNDDSAPLEMVSGEPALTLSTLPQQRRIDYSEPDDRIDALPPVQQNEPQNINVAPMTMDDSGVLSQQDSFSSQSGLKLRRSKYFKRQSRVQPDEREIRKQTSEPVPSYVVTPAPLLQKHESYPQYATSRRSRTQDHEVGSLLIRPVTVIDRQPSTSASEASFSDASPSTATSQTPRVSHTPAVRSGPPLSCNFCWNTVDECGRILRRKTQYHCPECRTNLCIVPCFHEYHDGPESDPNNAR
ncbi:protein tramtrack, beta isoform-like [Achroia grisella]|uniref:protein tramtrack, beta isoform-like n=1 Tax=Achroia grisella TaxID=688607 RepID=UPI0027D30EA6|nr:protein tramtrack, beta isoform-like [Achroia grisella]